MEEEIRDLQELIDSVEEVEEKMVEQREER